MADKEKQQEQKKERKKHIPRRPNRPLLVIMCVLLAVVVVVNVFLEAYVSPYYGLISTFLTTTTEDEEVEEAAEASADITEEIESEGIILLRNEDDVLPLEDVTYINVFGVGANDFAYGGTGSGSGDSEDVITFYQGLEDAGFVVNPDLVEFYETSADEREDLGLVGTDFGIYELGMEEYSDELLASAEAYSDTAIIVISRLGGEGSDLPMDMEGYDGGEAGKSYLELNSDELELVEYVTSTYENVIVILNACNAMELGWLEDYDVDAALWVGFTGSTGCEAIGEVLNGTVNPSGRTTDTFAYALESAPSYYSFGDYTYTNATYTNESLFGGTGDASTGENYYSYVDYIEGIYVGYRYYETAAADGFIDYDETVQYAFGYGLSYTTFEQEIIGFTDDGTTITLDIQVTNTGDVAGKEVVQVYYTAPYYEGGIEKSEVVLIGFDKTSELDPGESETVTISFDYEDMASYDYLGIKAEGGAYVLEAGEYVISVRENSHDVIESVTVTVDEDIIYNDENDGARSTDEVAATNQFDDVSFTEDITYLSRADWEGTFPTERAADSREASDEVLALLEGEELDDGSDLEDITTGANNGLTIYDMVGVDYDDELWDDFLDQLTIDDMLLLTGNGGWMTIELDSIDLPYLVNSDGPAGVNNIMSNMLSGTTGNQFTAQAVLAYTWNTELAYEMGEAFGAEIVAIGYTGIYAPGCNIHRSPFGGRNFEYSSEDGYLTGMMVAAEVQGIQSNGVYCFTKHFALNDQETNRDEGGLVTWANEQAIREIYLKAFEIAVKDGGTQAIMTSFNRIGATPTAESYELLTTILRDEWGFEGMVITDCVMACQTQDYNRALRAGNDLQLSFLSQFLADEDTTDTVAGHIALRQASKNILYTIANSNALEIADTSMNLVQQVIVVVDVILAALFALYFVVRHICMKRWVAAGKPKGLISRGIAKLRGKSNDASGSEAAA